VVRALLHEKNLLPGSRWTPVFRYFLAYKRKKAVTLRDRLYDTREKLDRVCSIWTLGRQ